jgi:hypothetical protein
MGVRALRAFLRNLSGAMEVDMHHSADINCKPAFRSIRATASIAIFSLLAGGLMLAGPIPASSQGVELLRVDVAVLAKGHRVSKLVGRTVTNDKKEDIGTLDDIIIDRKNVLFAIIQVGGFLGIGGRLVAVPYERLTLDEKGNKIELPGATREELKKLAEFKYET